MTVLKIVPGQILLGGIPYLDKHDDVKAKCAEEVAKVVAETLGCDESSVSVAIKEVEKDDWKNSKDAVERTVNKLRGWCVGKEPVDQGSGLRDQGSGDEWTMDGGQ